MSGVYYPPLEVYKNLHHFLKNRDLELVLGYRLAGTKKVPQINPHKYLGDQDFIKNIQFDKFIMVEAKDLPSKDRRYNKNVPKYCSTIPTRTFIIILDRQTEVIKATELQKVWIKIPDIK